MLRSFVESLVCLALAVIVFRSFEVEGYMISTGSMAPHLLGFHKRTICPSCGWHFTCGVMYDESVSDQVQAVGEHDEDPIHAVCPNCGLPAIDLSHIPRNHGDQLLVSKSAYEFAEPRRWDVIVFRNPAKATQAYVKRVVGLPGESIQVVHGDVWINGKIERKDLTAQRALRIPVFDSSFEPGDDDVEEWQSRWFHGTKSGWSHLGSGYRFAAGQASPGEGSTDYDWLAYRNWIRQGGYHTTAVLLSEDSPEPTLPSTPFKLVRYNAENRTLSCTGALPQDVCESVKALNSDERLNDSVDRLYEESHITPVMDDYGYNRLSAGMLPVPIRDLMLAGELQLGGGSGQAVIEMGDGPQKFSLEFDTAQHEVRLVVDGGASPVRTAPLPDILKTGALVEMSLFDRQVLVAIDGVLLFDPLILEDVPADKEMPVPPRRAVRIGARGMNLALDSLVLYRDVHYTRGKAKNGVDEPYALGPDSFFMLGDNSPVSSDSRNWDVGSVPRGLVLGKPFVVHLPSRPARFGFAGREYQIRVPDLSQIRYIR